MLDLDELISRCADAAREAQPHLAVKEVLERVMASPSEVAATLPPTKAEIVRLYESPEVNIMKVVWAPGMRVNPHDHRMWAAIGIYTGGEDNTFFRRDGVGLTTSGGRALRVGDVCLLGDDVIHAVHNPTTELAGAIHVYGGNFVSTPRSEWMGDPPVECPYDAERVAGYFDEANRTIL